MTFEAELAARLRDLAAAGEADGWADPLPAMTRPEPRTARPNISSPSGRRLRLLPYLAAAAVVLAIVVGVGAVMVGARGHAGSSASAGGQVAVAGDNASGTEAGGTGPSGPATGFGGAPAGSCGSAPVSSGPLATLVAVTARPVGELVPDRPVPVTFTFGGPGPTLQARSGQALLISGSSVIAQSAGAHSFAIVAIPVRPGSQESTVPFDAVACDGSPVPPGSYQLVVAYGYTVAGGGRGTLVSAPVAVTVG